LIVCARVSRAEQSAMQRPGGRFAGGGATQARAQRRPKQDDDPAGHGADRRAGGRAESQFHFVDSDHDDRDSHSEAGPPEPSGTDPSGLAAGQRAERDSLASEDDIELEPWTQDLRGRRARSSLTSSLLLPLGREHGEPEQQANSLSSSSLDGSSSSGPGEQVAHSRAARARFGADHKQQQQHGEQQTLGLASQQPGSDQEGGPDSIEGASQRRRSRSAQESSVGGGQQATSASQPPPPPRHRRRASSARGARQRGERESWQHSWRFHELEPGHEQGQAAYSGQQLAAAAPGSDQQWSLERSASDLLPVEAGASQWQVRAARGASSQGLHRARLVGAAHTQQHSEHWWAHRHSSSGPQQQQQSFGAGARGSPTSAHEHSNAPRTLAPAARSTGDLHEPAPTEPTSWLQRQRQRLAATHARGQPEASSVQGPPGGQQLGLGASRTSLGGRPSPASFLSGRASSSGLGQSASPHFDELLQPEVSPPPPPPPFERAPSSVARRREVSASQTAIDEARLVASYLPAGLQANELKYFNNRPQTHTDYSTPGQQASRFRPAGRLLSRRGAKSLGQRSPTIYRSTGQLYSPTLSIGSTNSIFTLYALRYAYDKFQLALRAFHQWYRDNLAYNKLSHRMEYRRDKFERWYASKGRPLSLRTLDHYDRVVIWIAGECKLDCWSWKLLIQWSFVLAFVSIFDQECLDISPNCTRVLFSEFGPFGRHLGVCFFHNNLHCAHFFTFALDATNSTAELTHFGHSSNGCHWLRVDAAVRAGETLVELSLA